MKKILIALDYGTTAQKVAEKGYELAKTMNGDVTLLHVIADDMYYSSLEYSPVMGYSGFNSNDFLKFVDADGLTKASLFFLDKFKHHLGDDKINTVAEKGDFAEVILETAKKLNIDTIVMGSHGERWLEKVLLGSVTEKVLNHTSIPLFIIPTKPVKHR